MTDKTTEHDAATDAQRPVDVLVMRGVDEYCEEMNVKLSQTTGKYNHGVPDEQCEGYGRLVVRATNEGGCNSTEVDLEQLLKWVAENKPEIYMRYVSKLMMRDYT